MDRVIVSTHVAKAGGSTFRQVLADVFSHEKVMYDHFPPFENPIDVLRVQSKWMGIEFNKEDDDKKVLEVVLEKGLKAIHGHNARIERWENILPKFTAISWIRHPVDRVLSQYYFEKRANKKEYDIPPDTSDLISFCTNHRNRTNRITKFIPIERIEDYSFIGLVEKYEDHLGFFLYHYSNSTIENIPRINYNPERNDYRNFLDKEIIEIIEELNEKDMELYFKVKDLWKNGYYGEVL